MNVIRKSILELSEKEKKEIDNFIEQNNGLIFHETRFNEIASETFNTKLSYFLTYIDNQLIGICPVHSVKKGLLVNSYSNNGSFEIPYGGWVFDKNFVNFLSLWDHQKIKKNESLIYWTSPLIGYTEKHKINCKKLITGILNLNNSEEEIFNNIINSKRRNMIRKGYKSAIDVKKNGLEGLQYFYKLKQNTNNKTGLNEPVLKYYEKILSYYHPRNKAVLMIAFYNGRPLSSLMLVGNKNIMHYWQGASINNVPNLGQGELLQWEAIKWAKNQGAKYYDLCVIEPERLPNIAQFKMGFTKELIPFYCINKKSFFFKVINKIQNVLIN